jgi:hypothetical protein
MNLFKKFVEYKWFRSKNNNKTPFTYEAKLQVFEGSDDITISWFSDTICGLCKYLSKHKEDPNDITIYECFNQKEIEMPKHIYMNPNSQWKPKKELCKAHRRYGSDGSEECCAFQGRDSKVSKI